MTKSEQIDMLADFQLKCSRVIMDKGDDYAGDDRLSNFKKVGMVSGMGAERSLLVLISTKVARLGELLDGRVVKNESVEDSLVDLSNYAALLYMVRMESSGAANEVDCPTPEEMLAEVGTFFKGGKVDGPGLYTPDGKVVRPARMPIKDWNKMYPQFWMPEPKPEHAAETTEEYVKRMLEEHDIERARFIEDLKKIVLEIAEKKQADKEDEHPFVPDMGHLGCQCAPNVTIGLPDLSGL